MANQEQGMQRGRFSTRLTQMEMEASLLLIPLFAVAGMLDFQQGGLLFLDIVDSLGKPWLFLSRLHTTGVRQNYVTIYFPEFLSEKGLKPNDELIFVQQPHEDYGKPSPWRVEIKRKIQLFGKNMWGDVVV